MIISRTPLRMSFIGGGSDLASFYKYQQGAVISTAINKYIYITVNKKFDESIRASYSITEFVDNVDDLKHELIRESLKLLKINGGIEITSISDIPSKGTGLGSSSTYTVGLLNALHAYKGVVVSAENLAKKACLIEIDKCQKPIGKQDQYAASFGNFNYIRFNQDGSVSIDPIICNPNVKKKLENNLLMLYTGLTRASETILEKQNKDMEFSFKKKRIMGNMVDLVAKAKRAIETGDLDEFGYLLHQNWEFKKQMSEGISTSVIDSWYKIARDNGAIGGKILGAGGGGFLLVYAPRIRHKRICKALSDLKPIPFHFEPEGSKIIYYGEK